MGKPLALAHPDFPVTVHIWRVVGGVVRGRHGAVPCSEETTTLYRKNSDTEPKKFEHLRGITTTMIASHADH